MTHDPFVGVKSCQLDDNLIPGYIEEEHIQTDVKLLPYAVPSLDKLPRCCKLLGKIGYSAIKKPRSAEAGS